MVENFEAGKEVLIGIRVLPEDQQLNFEITAKVTDILKVSRQEFGFVMQGVAEKSFLYVHEFKSQAKVCFTSNVKVRVRIAIDVDIKLPEGLIESQHMKAFNDVLYEKLKLINDMISEHRDIQKEDRIIKESENLSSRILSMTLLECSILILFGFL